MKPVKTGETPHLFHFFTLHHVTGIFIILDSNPKAGEAHVLLEIGDHLVQVLVDLGELGGELLVLEVVALLVEDLGHGGDQQQPLLGVGLGEADGLARGQLQGGARGPLASQVPERFRLGVSFWLKSLTWQRRGGASGGRRWPRC